MAPKEESPEINIPPAETPIPTHERREFNLPSGPRSVNLITTEPESVPIGYTDPVETFADLERLRFSDGSIMDHATKFMKIVDKFPPGYGFDDLLRDLFISQCPPKIRQFSQNEEKVEDLISARIYAERIEYNLKRSNNVQNIGDFPVLKSLAEPTTSKKRNFHRITKNPSPSRRRDGHSNKKSDRIYSIEMGLCFVCMSPGHKAKDCPTKSNR